MKKALLIFVSVLVISLTVPRAAYAADVEYAVISDACILYADEAKTERIVTLPASYFVAVTKECDDAYAVEFTDLKGFVDKERVSRVDYTPMYKFPAVAKTVVSNDSNTVTLRSSPSHVEQNTVGKRRDGEEVTYYGPITGSSQIPALGNTWYYVKTDDGKFGYVYSLYAEPYEFPQNDLSPLVVPSSAPPKSHISLEGEGKYVLIASLCIPVLLLFFLLLKDSRKNKSE